MHTMSEYYEIRCPGKREHLKRSGNDLVVEDNCSMLLTFIGKDVTTDEHIYCKNCKRLVHITGGNGEFNLELLPKGKKLDTLDGICTVDEY